MQTAILINRGGGSAGERHEIEAALEAAGIAGDVEWLAGHEIAEAARRAANSGADLLIAGGGDGTVSCVAGAVAGTQVRLAILPLGTLNHFARDLGLPLDIGECARVIATGRIRAIDVAEVNGRVFVNNSAIGIYPLMVLDRDSQRRRLGRSKSFAMIVASLRTLIRFHHRRLTLTVNDERVGRVDTPLLFVGNNDYRTDIGGPGRRESLDDGRLCVFVLRKKTARGLIAATVRALLNRSRDDDMVRIDGVERLRVSSRRALLAVSLDGETDVIDTPLDYRIRPKALNVVVP